MTTYIYSSQLNKFTCTRYIFFSHSKIHIFNISFQRHDEFKRIYYWNFNDGVPNAIHVIRPLTFNKFLMNILDIDILPYQPLKNWGYFMPLTQCFIPRRTEIVKTMKQHSNKYQFLTKYFSYNHYIKEDMYFDYYPLIEEFHERIKQFLVLVSL